MNRSENIWRIVIVAVCLIYILLRFWRLTDSCLWFDEIFGVQAASMDWENLFWFVAQDLIHPPLFYVLLKIWISIGGESVFWLRFFSIFFSILALVPFYFLCRQLKLSYPAIFIALTFFALNGALVKYAQDVRMYALLMSLSLFSIWLFTRFLHLGKNIWILTLVNILLVYAHYFGWLVVLAEIAAILILQRIKWRQILIMFGICLVCFAPWIFAVFRATQTDADLAQNIGWIYSPDLRSLFQFLFDLIEPFYFQASNIEPASTYVISIPLLLVIIAAKIIYILNFNSFEETEKRDFRMLVVFIAIPVIIALTASWLLPYSIWGSRHLIIVFAPTAILLGIFFAAIKPPALKIVLFSVLFLLFLTAFILEINRPKKEFIWCAWERLAQSIDANRREKLYVFEDLVAYHFWFAEKNNPNIQIIKINNLEGVEEDKAYFLPRGFDEVKRINFNEIKEARFLVAFRDKEWNLQKSPLKNLIEKGYRIGEPKIYEAQGLKAFLVEVKNEN